MSVTVELDMTRADVAAFGRNLVKERAKVMREWSSMVLNRLVSQRINGRPGLIPRTGNLKRDWLVTSDDKSATIQSTGTGNSYAGLQESGGTVTAKRSKFLWIPIAGNLTASGVARISPREAITRGGFIRGGVFYSAPLVKSRRKSAGPEIVPLFALKKSVHIPARLGATDLFTKAVPVLDSALTYAMAEAEWR